MLTPWFVGVGNHHHVGATESLAVLVAPLAGTARVARRVEPPTYQGLDVLLPLDDVDGSAGLHGLNDFGQPVEHAGVFAELPKPAAVSVWPSLAKVLGLEPDHLVEQLAGFVGVVVGCHLTTGTRRLVKEIRHR